MSLQPVQTQLNGPRPAQDTPGAQGAGQGAQGGALLNETHSDPGSPESDEESCDPVSAHGPKEQKELAERLIKELEKDIRLWRARHSQSDPGAVMELREMQRELTRWRAVLEDLKDAEMVEQRRGVTQRG